MYPLYISVTLFNIKFEVKKIFALIFLIILNFLLILYYSQSYKISFTAFFISILLQIPFLFYLFGINLKNRINAKFQLRALNTAVFCFSLINMISQGFPLKLPYVHFSPDYFSGFFGFGGAKIVTLIGFFSLISELHQPTRNKKHLILSIINFIMPSFIIGIIIGIVSFGILFLKNRLRNKTFLILIIITISIFITPYIFSRYKNMNNEATELLGYHPKIYSYKSVIAIYEENPEFLVFGCGIGQYSSTPAIWTSEYVRSNAKHEIPKIGDLQMTEIHEKYFGRDLNKINLSSYSLSSSFNKPYTSITTLLIEQGMLFTLFILGILVYRLIKSKSLYLKTLILFSLILLILDLNHDNLWLGYLLLLSNRINIQLS